MTNSTDFEQGILFKTVQYCVHPDDWEQLTQSLQERCQWSIARLTAEAQLLWLIVMARDSGSVEYVFRSKVERKRNKLVCNCNAWKPIEFDIIAPWTNAHHANGPSERSCEQRKTKLAGSICMKTNLRAITYPLCFPGMDFVWKER